MTSCAAVTATLTSLRDDPPYQRVESHGDALMDGIRNLGRAHGLPLRVQGAGMAFHVSFGDQDPVHDLQELMKLDLPRYAELSRTLIDHGVWVTGRGIWYVSAAHADVELKTALERVDAALSVFGTDPDPS